MRVNRTVKRQNLFYLIFFLGGWLKRTGYLLHFSFFLYLIWKQPFQVVVYGTLQKRKEKTKQNRGRASQLSNCPCFVTRVRARASDLRKKILSSQMNCLGLFKVLIKQKKQGWRVYVSSQMAFHLGVKIWPKMGTHWAKKSKKSAISLNTVGTF